MWRLYAQSKSKIRNLQIRNNIIFELDEFKYLRATFNKNGNIDVKITNILNQRAALRIAYPVIR